MPKFPDRKFRRMIKSFKFNFIFYSLRLILALPPFYLDGNINEINSQSPQASKFYLKLNYYFLKTLFGSIIEFAM